MERRVWLDGPRAGAHQRAAELAEAATAEELRKQKVTRIAEAQALRAVGAQSIRRIIERIHKGELNDIPLVGRMVYRRKIGPAEWMGSSTCYRMSGSCWWMDSG